MQEPKIRSYKITEAPKTSKTGHKEEGPGTRTVEDKLNRSGGDGNFRNEK